MLTRKVKRPAPPLPHHQLPAAGPIPRNHSIHTGTHTNTNVQCVNVKLTSELSSKIPFLPFLWETSSMVE